MIAIKTDKLTKTFDNELVAVDGLSISVNEGEVLGLLGPNGAGKTTAIRLLNGIIKPTSGFAQVLGISVEGKNREIRSKCGVMTETAAPYENLTAFENLSFFGQMHNINPVDLNDRINWLFNFFGLTAVRNKKIKAFSSGMKKKVSLCIALLHNPSILFLDEPTSSLDPETSRDVTNLIKQLAEEQHITVVLCTHQLKYAQDICTSFAFLNKGKLIGLGSYEKLLEQKDKCTYLEIRGEKIDGQPGFTNNNGWFTKPVISDHEASLIISEVINSGGKIYEAKQKKLNLEDLYFLYIKN